MCMGLSVSNHENELGVECPSRKLAWEWEHLCMKMSLVLSVIAESLHGSVECAMSLYGECQAVSFELANEVV